MGIIYKCTNTITHKVYIGQTIRNLDVRKYEHIKELNKGLKKGIWQEEYLLYGKTNFIFEVLEEVSDNMQLNNLEQHYISKFNSLEPFGYNKVNTNGSSQYHCLKDKLEESGYSFEELSLILSLLLSRSPIYKVKEISEIVGRTENAIQDIARGKSLVWLGEYIPEYLHLKEIYSSKINRISFLQKEQIIQAFHMILSNYNTYEILSVTGLTKNQINDLRKGTTYEWLADKYPEEYKILHELKIDKRVQRTKEKLLINTITKEKVAFTTCVEGGKLLNLDHRRLGELLNGKRLEYKDWKLA